MMIISLISLISALVMCVIISITDIKENKISNKTLAVFWILGVFFIVLHLLFQEQVLWKLFFLNLMVTSLMALVLYIIKVWAAGDSKALIVLAGLLPAELGILQNRVVLSGIMVVVFSFIFSFLYLIAESFWLYFGKKIELSKKGIRNRIKLFGIAFVRNVVYLSLVLKIEKYHTGDWYEKHPFVVIGVNICIILIISNIKIFKRRSLIILAFIGSLLFSIIFQEWFLDEKRIKYYLLMIVIMIVRSVISEYNYETIPTKDVKKGMILSTFTTMMMVNSKVKGLPEISKEDMRNRLTEEEAQAVIRWGKSKKGMENVQIVRKTPFAIFICLGLIGYTIFWGIMG